VTTAKSRAACCCPAHLPLYARPTERLPWQIWDYASARKDLNLSGLFPTWRTSLATQLDPALPLFKSGALVGVFLGDEMMCAFS
jgi:hypothetical protein